jgi:hypothetical protein
MEHSAFINFFSSHQWIIPIIIAWSLAWKGIALWKAARNKSIVWFIVLLVINTLGLLEIVYIFLFSRENIQPKEISGSEEKAEKKIV